MRAAHGARRRRRAVSSACSASGCSVPAVRSPLSSVSSQLYASEERDRRQRQDEARRRFSRAHDLDGRQRLAPFAILDLRQRSRRVLRAVHGDAHRAQQPELGAFPAARRRCPQMSEYSDSIPHLAHRRSSALSALMVFLLVPLHLREGMGGGRLFGYTHEDNTEDRGARGEWEGPSDSQERAHSLPFKFWPVPRR